MARTVEAACTKVGVTGKLGGAYLCMECPQFSTKAESNLYRSWGMDVIGMTNLQEAKLAREAEICYVTVAMITDYDCWHPHHDSVTVDQIVAVLTKNAENACNVVREAVAAMPKERGCKCGSALAHAILTDRAKIPQATRERLKLIIDRKSTRLNSSHSQISYAVFCLKKKISQNDAPAHRSHGGLELGLSIVRHIAELHHGTVTAQRPGEGMGTTMEFEFKVYYDAGDD